MQIFAFQQQMAYTNLFPALTIDSCKNCDVSSEF